MKMTIHIEIENNEHAEAIIKTLAGISSKATMDPVTESTEPTQTPKAKTKTAELKKSIDIDDLRTKPTPNYQQAVPPGGWPVRKVKSVQPQRRIQSRNSLPIL